MCRIVILCFIIGSLLGACRGIRSLPSDYARPQVKNRHLIAIFMDGTRGKMQDNARRNTNLLKAYYLADTSIKTLYIEGVGAGNRVKDGMYALTSNERVMRAYRFLTENYKPGDTLCLFGFSRGANQCRILSGIVYTIGLIDLSKIKSEKEKQRLLLQLYELYRSTPAAVKKQTLATYMNRWEMDHPGETIAYDTTGKMMIDVMGLWDTVEALSVNDEFETITPVPHHLNQLFNVKKIFHAVSLDDNRAFNYTPILVTHKEVELQQHPDSIVKEVWFNGCHKDVGGGIKYKKRDQLSGISLKWMLSSLKPYAVFRDTVFQTDIYGEVNDMRRKWWLRRTSPGDTLRAINKYWEQMNVNWNNHRLMLHQSVIDRLDSGIVQSFKFRSRKDGSKRADWYEWEPFKHCFKKDTIHGMERIRFRKDTICACITIVNDHAALIKTITKEVEQPVNMLLGERVSKSYVQEIESPLSVVYKMNENRTLNFVMTNYKPFKAELYQEQHLSVEFFKHEKKSIMLVKLTGAIPDGSEGRMDCSYIKQQLTINLLAMRPVSLLLDMSLLSYSYGNSLIDALSPLFELQIFESKFDIAFLLSDLNKYGLASLWALDLTQPPENIFFRNEEALQYVEAAYDSL